MHPDDYATEGERLGFSGVTAIPVSALRGDNVTERSARTSWYDGPTLMEWLHEVPPRDQRSDVPLRLPVQWVNRPDPEFRGVAGQVVGGCVRVSDEIVVEPSGVRSRVRRIVSFDGDLDVAGPERSVTILFDDEIDASRGDVVCSADEPASIGDELDAQIVWMDDHELVPGRAYQLRLASRSAVARVLEPICKIDPTPASSIRRARCG